MDKSELFYVHKNSAGYVFVKDEALFVAQGGLTLEWGRAWRPLRAVGLEAARDLAIKLYGGKKVEF